MKGLMHNHNADGNEYPETCPLCRIFELETFLSELRGIHMRRHDGKPSSFGTEEWEFETICKLLER